MYKTIVLLRRDMRGCRDTEESWEVLRSGFMKWFTVCQDEITNK